MNSVMYFGLGFFCVLWAACLLLCKKYLYNVSPILWTVIFYGLSVVTALYVIYSLFRIITAKRTKAEWFERSGVIGNFSLKPEKSGYFFTKIVDEDDYPSRVVCFSWISARGDIIKTELPIEKIFIEAREIYIGEPIIQFIFQDTQSTETFRHIHPRIKKPSWWLKSANAERVGFLYARVIMSINEYKEESLYVAFPQENVHKI